MSKNTPPKILLFHDTFLMKGGAERMNIEIAKSLGADIATAYWSPHCYNPREMGFTGRIFEVHPNFTKGMVGFLRMKWAFFRTGKKVWKESENWIQGSDATKARLSDYDIVLFSNEAISAIWNTPKTIKTYYYAHSISRHLFDLYDEYLQKVPLIARIPYRIMAWILRKIYIKELKKIDQVFTNSSTNVARIAEWMSRDDAVFLPPPVDTKHFNEKTLPKDVVLPYKDYYISFSRLTHVKCIDAIIRAFQECRDKNVVILFGENDSQKEEFMRLAGITPDNTPYPCYGGEYLTSPTYPNITFVRLHDNNLLPDYISSSIASICMSKEEDFGMVAIESMACGIPVIAVDEGGYRETIIHGETGWLLDPADRTKSLVAWLKQDHTITTEMQVASKKQAEKFSINKFFSYLGEKISLSLAQR